MGFLNVTPRMLHFYVWEKKQRLIGLGMLTVKFHQIVVSKYTIELWFNIYVNK